MRTRTFLKQQFRRLGLEVSRFNKPDSFTARRQRLLKRLEINLVLDAGASDGGFGLELRSAGYTGKIVSFEPLPAPFESLQGRLKHDATWTAFPWALGDACVETKMFVTRDDKCSSLLKPLDRQTTAYAGSAVSGTAMVQIKTLDSIYSDIRSRGDRPFLKIDTQGYEMHVLRGARKTLDSIVGLQIELSLVQLYEGNPSYTDMLNFMEECGFALFAMEPVFSNPVTDQLLQVDALFILAPGEQD